MKKWWRECGVMIWYTFRAGVQSSASALLRGNTIFHLRTFRNIVYDVEVVDWCLATTPPVSWQQSDKGDWSASQPIKKHVCVVYNDV